MKNHDSNNCPRINKWACSQWVWANRVKFQTLKETKAWIDDACGDRMHEFLTEYEGYDTILHYDENGFLSSIVKIIPDETSYHRYHYGKPKRVNC